MATRKEILSDLSGKIAGGNISEAYRSFEELPVVDQIAVSIAPGVGDVLAAYEVKEFGSRAKKNVQDKDYLGAAGNTGLQVLSGVSLIPLFRLLRGAKAVAKGSKAVDVPTPKPEVKPTPKTEPLQLAPPKEVAKIELPEVQPFNTQPAKELAYQTTQDYLPLQSKARKFLHGHYKKIDPEINELSPEDWVKTLTNPNNEIPLGELRLLNVLDEMNELHPKFIKVLAGENTISKQGLDNYLSRQQTDALQIRNAPPGKLQSSDTEFVNNDLKNTQQQKLYHVRGAGEQRTIKGPHFPNLEFTPEITGNNAYVFDGTGINYPMARYTARAGNLFNKNGDEVSDYINDALKKLDINEADNFSSIFRVQSDFVKEVSGGGGPGFFDPKKMAVLTKKLLRYNNLVDEINPIIAKNPNREASRKLINDVLKDTFDSIKDDVPVSFRLDPEDIPRITGKPFIDSLNKTPEDIFYMFNASGKQKYIDVPPDDLSLSKAYFEDLITGSSDEYVLKDGVRILKRAIIPKADANIGNKFKIDPYFEKTTSNEMKLPVRANVLEAYKAGKAGIHIGPRQAIMEGGRENIVEKYTRGEKEIQKILDELGLGNKKKELTTRITDTGTEFDGTYLKFTDELKKAIEEQGINAFKDGGPVDIDNMLSKL